MNNDKKDIADIVITTTPKTIFILITIALSSYLWIFSTFATQTEVNDLKLGCDKRFVALTDQIKNHIEAELIQRLEERLEDTGDKRWLIQQRIASGDNTPENLKQEREFAKRESKTARQLECMRNEGTHCIENY